MNTVTVDKATWMRNGDGFWVSFRVREPQAATEICEKLQDGKVRELTVRKQRRSLNANNYSWTLTDKLSDVMVVRGVKLSKEQMHAEMICRYGQPMYDENGNFVVLSTKQDVPISEFYPYAKLFGESELNGETFYHYRIYRGSHTYDTQEMATFIAGIVEECKEQGIETLSERERSLLVEKWGTS